MIRTLVPIDGSENSLRALRHVIALAGNEKAGPDDIHLVNVQPSLGGGVSAFVGNAAIQGYHRDEGDKALAAARALLDEAKLPCHAHIGVGSPGEVIVAFAKDLKAERVVMGTRGLGRLAEILLGSCATEVIRSAPVPVTLIR